MREESEREGFLEQAREGAEGTEFYEDPLLERSLEVQTEAAQGVEVFQNPDSVVPPWVLKEGAPGHESFTGDGLDDGRDEEDERAQV